MQNRITIFILSSILIIVFQLFQVRSGKKEIKHPAPSSFNYWITGIALLFILKLIVCDIILIKDEAFLSADDYSRMNYIANWARSPYFSHGNHVWPSGHFWVLGFIVRSFFQDIELAIILTSLISGLLALMFLGLFTWSLTRNIRAAMWSILLFAAFPLHTWLSVSGLVDIHYWMLLLAGAWLYSEHIRNKKKIYVFVTLAFLMWGISASLRYEAWIFKTLFCAVFVVYEIFLNTDDI